MISKTGAPPAVISVQTVRRQRGLVWALGSFLVVIVSAILVLFGQSYSLAGSIAIFVVIGAIVAATMRPILGVYAIVFLALIGDGETSPWLLFSWNFSSRGTSVYLNDKLFVSPLEVLVGATLVCWLLSDRPRRVVTGTVFWSIAVFTGFVAFGFVRGIAAGGDIRISFFEGRAMFLLLPVYTLIVNLFDAAALKRLLWTAVVAILAQVFVSLNYLESLTSVERAGLEALGEHSTSVLWNVIIVLAVALVMFRVSSGWSGALALAACAPVLMVYLAAERRAAVVGLVLALALLVLAMLWHDRKKFFVIAPVVVFLLAGYTAAFWNTTSGAGFPAQAIKTVVAGDQTSDDNRGSDMYRQIENFDLNYTIRASPVIGLGFGHEFYRPVALPDLSFFVFNRFIPHNNILWIWIKTGFFGFVSMFVMFAVGIRAGARTFTSHLHDMTGVVALVGTAYVLMYVTYAFVDIAWDARSMIFLALSFALCSQHERDPVRSIADSAVPRRAVQHQFAYAARGLPDQTDGRGN
jgi:O-antigen ligase